MPSPWFGHHILHRSGLSPHPASSPWHVERSPLPARATASPIPLHPLPCHVGSRGRAGGQTCQSKHRRHAATPQTPITTQQGRGLATAWQPHGPIRVHNNRDQRRPRKVRDAVFECVCLCMHLCALWMRQSRSRSLTTVRWTILSLLSQYENDGWQNFFCCVYCWADSGSHLWDIMFLYERKCKRVIHFYIQLVSVQKETLK